MCNVHTNYHPTILCYKYDGILTGRARQYSTPCLVLGARAESRRRTSKPSRLEVERSTALMCLIAKPVVNVVIFSQPVLHVELGDGHAAGAAAPQPSKVL